LISYKGYGNKDLKPDETEAPSGSLFRALCFSNIDKCYLATGVSKGERLIRV